LYEEEDLRSSLREAAEVISNRIFDMTQCYSNLVAIDPCYFGGVVMIRLMVSCKNYVPVDEVELQKTLDGCYKYYKRSSNNIWVYDKSLMPESFLIEIH
jgi:hypothetical protein